MEYSSAETSAEAAPESVNPPPPMARSPKTYSIQRPPSQYSFRSSRHTAASPLQVPHDVTPRDLREHVGDLLHVGGVCLAPCGSGVGGGVGGGGGEEEVFHSEGAKGGEEEEGGDGDGLVGIGHVWGGGGKRWVRGLVEMRVGEPVLSGWREGSAVAQGC